MAEPSPIYSANEEFWDRYVRPRPGRTLIVGSRVYKTRTDRRKAFTEAVGIDMLPGEGVDWVLNLEDELPDGIGKFAHIECRSVLEHSRSPWRMAANLQHLLERGGTIDIAAPFVWNLHAYPSDYWRFTAEAVKELFPKIEWRAVRYAGAALYETGKTPRMRTDEHIYIERTEVLAFGVRP